MNINFRQSELKRLLRCPRQYQYSVLEGRGDDITSSAMLAGTAMHAFAEDCVRHHLIHGEWPAEDATEDVFVAAWKHVESQAGEIRWDEAKETIAAKVWPGALFWRTEIAPTLKPIAAEVKFRDVEVADGITIEGTIDLIEVGGVVRDWKTSGRKWVRSDVDRDVQAGMYSLAYRELFGAMPRTFIFEVLVRGHAPLHQRLEAYRSEEDVARLVALMESWATWIRAGVDLPMNPSGWWCSPRFCSHYDICPAGRGVLPLPPAAAADPIWEIGKEAK